jgi:hypothetical protein
LAQHSTVKYFMKLFLNVISKLIDYIKIMESKLSIKTHDVLPELVMMCMRRCSFMFR